MAYSYQEHSTANGTSYAYSFDAVSHNTTNIKITIGSKHLYDGVTKYDTGTRLPNDSGSIQGAEYTVSGTSSGGTVSILTSVNISGVVTNGVPTLSSSQKLKVFRQTNRTTAEVSFSSDSVLTDTDLNKSSNQSRFLSLEAVDRADDSLVATDDATEQAALASASATLAGNYANKIDGAVTGSDFSSKAHASSTDSDAPSTGSAKEWAQKTDGAVDTEFSSKAHASSTDGNAPATGSSKEWAINAGSAEVASGQGYSSKAYAQDETSGTDTSGGSSKGWAQTAKNTQVPGASSSDRSAKHYSEIASDHKTDAETAKAGAETALDTFDDRFLGAKSSAPTKDNDDNDLIEGALYWNSNSKKLFIWNDTSNTWVDLVASAGANSITGANTITSSDGNNLTLATDDNGEKVIINSGDKTIKLPNVRATEDDYVLSMTDKSTGETEWIQTAKTPTINSISGVLNFDQDSTLTLFGADFNANTKVAIYNASAGGDRVGAYATITNQTTSRLEAKFGNGDLNAGDVRYIEADNSGLSKRFGTAFTVSADPAITISGTAGANANSTNNLGTYGGVIGGGGDDSYTKVLFTFDRAGGQIIEDSSNIGDSGFGALMVNQSIIKASPFGDGKTALKFDGTNDYLAPSDHADWHFASDPFTIEMWLSRDSTDQMYLFTIEGDSNDWFRCEMKAEILEFNWYIEGTYRMTHGPTHGMGINEWYHVAFVRTTTYLRTFVNGRLIGESGSEAADNPNYSIPDYDDPFMIGSKSTSNTSNLFKGYIDEFRITKGLAVYTGEFTVPQVRLTKTWSSLGTNIADNSVAGNVKLLIHSNSDTEGGTTITDSSDTGHNLNASGVIHSKLHGGIAPAMAWPASLKKYPTSGTYFDGTGDHITFDDTTLLRSTHTVGSVDFWFNHSLASSHTDHGSARYKFPSLFSIGNTYGSMYLNGDNKLAWFLYDGGSFEYNTNQVMSADTWYHILMAWDDTSGIKIYIDGTYREPASSFTKKMSNIGDDGGGSDDYIRLGEGPDGNAEGFKGYIDNFRITNVNVLAESGDALEQSLNTSTAFASHTTGTQYFTRPSTIFGALTSRTVPEITLTGTSSTTLATEEDIEFTSVDNETITDGMRSLTDTNIGLVLTNQTGSNKNKATLTGTISSNFEGTSRDGLPIKAQVRATLGDASGTSGETTVTFSGSTTTAILNKGYIVSGTNVHASATIASVDSTTQITLSHAHTGTVTGTLIFLDPNRIQYINGGTTDALVTSENHLSIAIDTASSPLLFNARRYIGATLPTGSTQRSISGFGFEPDLVLIKNRGANEEWRLSDSVRGAKFMLHTDTIGEENERTNQIMDYNSDGFEVGSDAGCNQNDKGIISYGWKAGGPSSGTALSISNGIGSGTIADDTNRNVESITQSVNQNGGFSITEYTGTKQDTSTGYFPHNLGGAVEFIIIKSADNGEGVWSNKWMVWHKDLANSYSNNNFILLNENWKQGMYAGVSTLADKNFFPMSSASDGTGVDTLIKTGPANHGATVYDGIKYICYAWKAVDDVSAFGGYSGDSNAANRTITTGFAPSFVMIKSLTSGDPWLVYDNKRVASGTRNDIKLRISQNDDEETDTNIGVTLKTDDGFTIHGTTTIINGTGDTYIWCAFA